MIKDNTYVIEEDKAPLEAQAIEELSKSIDCDVLYVWGTRKCVEYIHGRGAGPPVAAETVL